MVMALKLWGFRVWGLLLDSLDTGLGVEFRSPGPGTDGLGFRVEGLGFRV